MFAKAMDSRWLAGLGVCALLLAVPSARSDGLEVPIGIAWYEAEAYASLYLSWMDPNYNIYTSYLDSDTDSTWSGEAHASVLWTLPPGEAEAHLGSLVSGTDLIEFWSELHVSCGGSGWEWTDGFADTSFSDGEIWIGSSDEYPPGTTYYLGIEAVVSGSGYFEFTVAGLYGPVVLDPENVSAVVPVATDSMFAFSFDSSTSATGYAGGWADYDVTIRIPEPATGTLAAPLGLVLVLVRRRRL